MADNLKTRPWRHGDLDLLRVSESLFAPETYPRRFLAGDRSLRPLHLKVSLQMSARGRRWIGQVAIDGDRLVALAECGWDPANPQSPDLAVMVADAWQQRGLGRRLLRELVRRCLTEGLTVFNLDYVASSATLGTLVESVTAETGEHHALSAVTGAGIGHQTIRVRHSAPQPL